jgi:hypothetical protein
MSNNTSSSGLGLSSVLTIIFVVLKLIGTIDWSWWWVLSPTLISTGLWLIFVAIYVVTEVRDAKKYGITLKKKKRR